MVLQVSGRAAPKVTMAAVHNIDARRTCWGIRNSKPHVVPQTAILASVTPRFVQPVAPAFEPETGDSAA